MDKPFLVDKYQGLSKADKNVQPRQIWQVLRTCCIIQGDNFTILGTILHDQHEMCVPDTNTIQKRHTRVVTNFMHDVCFSHLFPFTGIPFKNFDCHFHITVQHFLHSAKTTFPKNMRNLLLECQVSLINPLNNRRSQGLLLGRLNGTMHLSCVCTRNVA